ncbi:MAG TPA: Uma2 family endonuclease [Gemmataceae bacterium]|nr:Uma2 family endonuclease [Gemmataceae bacterium]
MSVAGSLLTVEEYLALPDTGFPNELVRGKIVPLYVPTPRHGQICGHIVYLIGRYLDAHDLGHLVCNDSGVITERNPDTVRGADVAFYSYQRVPRGPLPDGYLDVSPELIFEARSPKDRWSAILAKVGEYLQAGVSVVCVLDQMTERCHVYRNEEPVQVLTAEQELTIPDVLPEFRVVVRRFFE